MSAHRFLRLRHPFYTMHFVHLRLAQHSCLVYAVFTASNHKLNFWLQLQQQRRRCSPRYPHITCASLSKHPSGAPTSSLRRLTLHLLRHLHVHLEELGDAAIKANGLALVEVGFAVVLGYALLGARVY